MKKKVYIVIARHEATEGVLMPRKSNSNIEKPIPNSEFLDNFNTKKKRLFVATSFLRTVKKSGNQNFPDFDSVLITI